jgi:hypothetical protein
MLGVKSQHGNVETRECIGPAAHGDGTVNGATIDLKGYGEGQEFIVGFGTWSDGTHILTFQHALDDGTGSPATFTNIAATDLDGFQLAADQQLDGGASPTGTVTINDGSRDGEVYGFAYIGGQDYIRVERVTSSATTGAIFYVNVVSELRFSGKTPMNSTRWNADN